MARRSLTQTGAKRECCNSISASARLGRVRQFMTIQMTQSMVSLCSQDTRGKKRARYRSLNASRVLVKLWAKQQDCAGSDASKTWRSAVVALAARVAQVPTPHRPATCSSLCARSQGSCLVSTRVRASSTPSLSPWLAGNAYPLAWQRLPKAATSTTLLALNPLSRTN